jgi:hypothetical protein
MNRSCALAAIVLLGAGCSGRESPHPATGAPPPSALVIVTGAREVQRTDDYDGTLTYLVDDPLPASILRAQLAEALEQQLGWRRSNETLNSVVSGEPAGDGWFHYEEKNGRKVAQLIEAWTNPEKDLVTYVLRYEALPGQTVMATVTVTGVLTRASTAERLRRSRE